MSPRLKEERYVVVDYNRLKELIKVEKTTLQRLSEQININYNNLCRNLTKGKIQKDWLESIADYFDISINYLMGDTDIKWRRFIDVRNKYNSKEIISLYLISRGFEVDDLIAEKIKRLSDNELYEIDVMLLNLLAGKKIINSDILKVLNDNSSK